jgi:hypothetical protein
MTVAEMKLFGDIEHLVFINRQIDLLHSPSKRRTSVCNTIADGECAETYETKQYLLVIP